MATITKTIGTSGRDYSTVAAWENDLDNGAIYASGDIAKGVLYNDSDFDESPIINGGATIGLSQIILTVNEADRHDGTAGSGVRFLPSTDRYISTATTVPTIIEWIEIDGQDTYRQYIVMGGSSSDVTVRNCLLHNQYGGTYAIVTGYTTGSTYKIYNNIIYEINTATSTGRGIHIQGQDSGTWNYVYNNTVVNCNQYGIHQASGYTTVTNNILMGNGVKDLSINQSAKVTESYNLLSDATGSGTGTIQNATIGDQFVSLTSGSEDLHLKTGSDAIGAGTDLSGTFTNDIDDETRVTWDIGADYIFAPSTYDETGSGGAVGGGSATVQQVNSLTSSGGIVAGGIGLDALTTATSGGIVAGGNAIIIQTISLTGFSGIVAGGNTENQLISNDVSSGGSVVGGSVVESIVVGTSGGGILAGSASVFVSIFETSSGGVVIAGTGLESGSTTIVGSGGVLCGGSVDEPEVSGTYVSCPCNIINEIASGGLLPGGSSVESVDGVSGGISASGTALITVYPQVFDGLVACYPLDESASPYLDRTNNMLDGTTTLPPSIDSGVFCLNSNQFTARTFIACEADSIPTTQDFSVSMWVKIDTKYKERIFFSRGSGSAFSFSVGCSYLNHLMVRLKTIDDGDTITTVAFSDVFLQQDRWHHIAVSVALGDSVTLFVDGSLVGSEELTTTQTVSLSNANQIARMNQGQCFEGNLQEIRLFAEAKSSDYWLAEKKNFCLGGFVLQGDTVGFAG
ncbi:MAG: hypothetical protein H6824_01270 [Planctomycetaceae bacterium]|nr:hypothetical protein [Planctomycetaceae bacterium]